MNQHLLFILFLFFTTGKESKNPTPIGQEEIMKSVILCSGDIMTWAEYQEMQQCLEEEFILNNPERPEYIPNEFIAPPNALLNSATGAWSNIIQMPIIPVAGANLTNGKLMTWSARDRFSFGGNQGKTFTAVFDPLTNTSTEELVSNTQHDMFCPGTANLPDGRVMATGGSSSNKTSIYDPATDEWTAAGQLNIPRGYHAMATTAIGEVFTIGGSWSGGIGNKHAEIWREGQGWSRLNGIPVDPLLSGSNEATGNQRGDSHSWLFLGPNGKIFHAGPARNMHWFDVTGEGTVTAVGSRGDDLYSMNGTAVMYDVGKLLKMGGAELYSSGSPANARSYTIDINSETPAVQRVGDMNYARTYHNSVVLPTGEVFAVGGNYEARSFNDQPAVYTPEIWDPTTGDWTVMADMQVPRTYHSIALLLPDARVFVGGGGLCGSCPANHPDAEIFYPPYLYDANGNLATRPEIISAPTTGENNGTIQLSTDVNISSFVIMRMASVTHSTNNEERRVPLSFNNIGGNNYSLSIPGSTIAVPGYYMLFAMNANGTPSIAKTIQITNGTIVAPSNNGLQATYYDNIDFTGTTIERIDNTINFNWGSGSPDPQFANDTYSAIWEGEIEAPTSGTYTFYPRTDDGVRLYLNDQLITELWTTHAPTEISGTFDMVAGERVSIRMEYFENAGGAVAQLSWSGPGVNKTIIPSQYLFPNTDCENEVNVALGKSATQSSTYTNSTSTFGAENAVDGNTGGLYPTDLIMHTQNQANAWWQIDLGAIHQISKIKVWNRTDCCGNRLSNFHVLISDTPFSSTNLNNTINQAGVTNLHYPGTPGEVTTLTASRTGRYVRVQLAGSNILNLGEVEIMELSPVEGPCNEEECMVDSSCDDGNDCTTNDSYDEDCNCAGEYAFETTPGLGYDIGSGGGQTYIIGTNNHTYHWDQCNGNWVKIATTPLAARIDVDGSGTPWIIATDNSIHRWNGTAFTQLPGAGYDIGANGNTVFILGMNRFLSKWNNTTNNWNQIPSQTVQMNRIDATADGYAWMIGVNGRLYQHFSNWIAEKGDFECLDVSISESSNSIYVLSTSQKVYQYVGNGNFQKIGATNGASFTVGKEEDTWVVQQNTQVLRIQNCTPITLTGTPCDDDNDCTINDVYIDDCNCVGTVQDSDADGVCDAEDICPDFDDNLLGTACDDGDACTTGETYDMNCECSGGIFQDSDSDGVCDAEDICAGGDDNIDTDGDNIPDFCDPNAPPVASFTATPSGGPAPLMVDFDASGSSDVDGDNLTYSWEFGNAVISNGVTTSYTYTTPGTYIVTLQVNDGEATAQTTQTITVEEPVFGGCTTISSTTFESGLADWADIEVNASLATDPNYANSGSNTLLIVNDGSKSIATSPAFDLSTAANLQIDFSYITNSFEDAEDFWLQISLDGGNTFITQQTWVLTTDFQNNVRYNESVLVNGPFSANTKVRFRNDASASTDFLYLDDIILTACGANANNQAPTAALSANPTSGNAPLIVTFDGANSTDPEGDNLSYSWTFGDGNSALGQQVSHTYSSNGTFTATLTVSDGQYTDQATIQIVVDPATDGCTTLNSESFENDWGIWDPGTAASRSNNAQYANNGTYSALIVNDGKQSVISSSTYDLTGYVSLQVDFSFMTNSFEAGEDFWLQISTDGGATYTTLKEWTVENDFQNNVRYNESVSITGPFSTTTKVRFRGDATADTDYLYLDDIVLTACQPDENNQAPIASFTATPETGTVPLNVSFNASGSADFDGDPLTYSWSFGDGTTASGMTVGHLYQTSGSFTATLTVSDGQATNQISKIIMVEAGSGCTTEINENFESGVGTWTLGASATLLNNAQYANSGVYSILIVNDGNSSVLTSNTMDLSSYAELQINFSFITNSFEAEEDFWLQISTDGGATFTIEEEWMVEDDFQNNVRINETVVLNGPFSNNTQIRFRCDATADTDYLYIDDINITGCTSSNNLGIVNGNPDAIANQGSILSIDAPIHLFPNPVTEMLNIQYLHQKDKELSIFILDSQGSIRNTLLNNVVDAPENGTLQLDVSHWVPGVYFLQMIEGGDVRSKRFIVTK